MPVFKMMYLRYYCEGGCYGVNSTFNNILAIPFYWWRSTREKPSTQGRIQDFVLEGAKVGEGSGDRLMSPAGPGQSRSRGPRELMGFEYLGSFSVNNFEAFCECNEVY